VGDRPKRRSNRRASALAPGDVATGGEFTDPKHRGDDRETADT
jgi:hypothetical protein